MSADNSTPPQHTSRLRRARMAAMCSAAMLVVVGLGAFALSPPVHALKVAETAPLQMAANEPASRAAAAHLPNGAPFSFADLVERVSPAVVTITSETMTSGSGDDSDSDDDSQIPPQLRDFFNQFNQNRPQTPRKAISAGSGFIIDKSGYIVTNNHVIDNSSKITVTLPDKRTFTAKLIGTDPATDVALLKINSTQSLPTVSFGDDRTLRVGDWVIAVGNPFNLGGTVTAGIVSSIGRDVGGQYDDFIQIDAPINQGNSGGPTFDLAGQVVGMNSMIYSPSGGSVGIGFAIPASTIRDVVEQLKAHGKVDRGYLGVSIQTVTPDVASAMGLKDAKGALVATVVADGPAAKAGFQQGDVITAINGQAVEDNRDLTRKVALVPAGQTASFNVDRDGKALQLKATIAGRPSEDQLASNDGPAQQDQDVAPKQSAMGLSLESLTPQVRRARQLADNATGVVITSVDPNSDAADKGLSPGDVVLKIGNQAIASPADVQKGVADARKEGRSSVLLLVAKSAGGTSFVAIDIGKT